MASVIDDALYYQIKIIIGFWCRRRLDPKFLIQSSETLPVELTGTRKICLIYTTIEGVLLFGFLIFLV